MRWLPLFLLIVLTGCWATTPGKSGQSPLQEGADALIAAAPVLPGPFGGIAAGVGTIAALVGGFFAGRKRQEVFATGGSAAVAQLNPLTKALAERKWLFPLIGAFLDGGTAANLWHIDPNVLLTLNGALGLPAAGEFLKDALAAKALAAPKA